MVEWFIASVLKTEKVNSFQGSNPCLSKKIYISILSIKKNIIKKELKKLIFSFFNKFHIDIMDYSYVNNNSFCNKKITKIIFFLKKIKNIIIEIHFMTKYNFRFKIYKIIHFENKKNNKIFSIGNNFCWKEIFFLNKKYLIMSVIPGFGEQKFLKKTKKIFKKKSNIDGGINYNIYNLIKNYFYKIIIGSKIVFFKKKKSYFLYNFVKNIFLI